MSSNTLAPAWLVYLGPTIIVIDSQHGMRPSDRGTFCGAARCGSSAYIPGGPRKKIGRLHNVRFRMMESDPVTLTKDHPARGSEIEAG